MKELAGLLDVLPLPLEAAFGYAIKGKQLAVKGQVMGSHDLSIRHLSVVVQALVAKPVVVASNAWDLAPVPALKIG